MLLGDHINQIKNPNKPTAENTDNPSDNLAFLESGNNAANPCRKRNDGENQADKGIKPEIIFLSCHKEIPPIYFVLLLYYTNWCMSTSNKKFLIGQK